MKAGIGIIALVGMLASGGAMADGNELLQQCQAAVDRSSGGDYVSGYESGYCYGTINGVVGSIQTLNQYLVPEERTCLPDQMKQSQGARIVLKFLRDHPASLGRGGPFLVLAAFQDAYPCK